MAAFDALPECPLVLGKLIIPRDELVPPVDIYTDGILIIERRV
jgi:hypothetical protein